MPTREKMAAKLKEGKFLGLAPQTDRFYNRFIESVADIEQASMWLNMAWELAKFDTLQDLPPIVQVTVDMGYDRVIDTVTPDPEVATQDKYFRKKMLEELRKEIGK